MRTPKGMYAHAIYSPEDRGQAMTWFKVDDRFHSHPKVLGLSLAAAGLWVRAGSWCAAHETDGKLNRALLRTFNAPPRLAWELVAAGLWREESDGFSFKNWSEFQPTSAQIELRREQEKLKKRRQRAVMSPGDKPGTPAAPDPDPIPIPIKNSTTCAREAIVDEDPNAEGNPVRVGADWMLSLTSRPFHPMEWRDQLTRIGLKPEAERARVLRSLLADPFCKANPFALTPKFVLRQWDRHAAGNPQTVIPASTAATSRDQSEAAKRQKAVNLAAELQAQALKVKDKLAKLKPLVAAGDADAGAQSFTLELELQQLRDRFDRATRNAAAE